jgi:hypothetical protein
MKKRFFDTLVAICAALAALIFSGCGGGDDPVVANVTGPTNYLSFAGTTIEINPTLTFQTNAQLTYLNTVTSGSPWPAAATAVTGTYTYTPASNYQSGTMVITLPGSGVTMNLTLQNFTRQGGNITQFTTVYNGQSYTSRVTSGTLAATNPTVPASPPTTPPPPALGPDETAATAIPTGVLGSYNLVFQYAQNNSPVSNGTQKAFVIGASTLQFDGKTLTNPIFFKGNQNEWIFKDGSLWYAVSRKQDGSFNEINLAGPNGTPFYGQYGPAAAGGGTGGTTGGGTGGTGGGTGGGGSVPSGALAAGTTFTRTVSNVVVGPVGAAIPTGVPSYTVGTSVTFTVNSTGALTFSGLTVPFTTDGGSAYTYTQVLSAGNSDTVLVYKNSSGAPTSVALQFVRISGSLPPVVTMVNYTLN